MSKYIFSSDSLDIIQVREATTTVIENDSFHPKNIFPSSYKYFSVICTEIGSYGIKVGNYAGVIPGKGNLVIQIQPKVPINDFTYLLLRSNLLNHSLQTPFESNVLYQISGEDLESFFEALVLQFLKDLDMIHAKGLIRGTINKQICSSSIKGKIDINKTLKYYPQSFGSKVCQTITQYPYSTPENRVLYYCLKYLIQVPLKIISKKDLIKRLTYFTGIKEDKPISSDLSAVIHILEHGKLASQRNYYTPALNLAIAILNGSGITIGKNLDIEFKPLVFNTSDLFEQYIRNILRDIFKGSSISIINGRMQSKNFYMSGPSLINLSPDVVFIEGGKERLILDVKYKLEPSQSDHYQAWAYLEGFSLNHVIMVCASDTRKGFSTKEYSRGQRKVTVISFDLTKIKECEICFKQHISELLKIC